MKCLFTIMFTWVVLTTGNVWAMSYGEIMDTYPGLYPENGIELDQEEGIPKLNRAGHVVRYKRGSDKGKLNVSHTLTDHVTPPDHEGEPIGYIYERFDEWHQLMVDKNRTTPATKIFSLFVDGYTATDLINKLVRRDIAIIAQFVSDPSIPLGQQLIIKGSFPRILTGNCMIGQYNPGTPLPNPTPVACHNVTVMLVKNHTFIKGYTLHTAYPSL